MNVLFVLALFAIWLSALFGWVLNVFAAVTLIIHSAPISPLFLGRLLGIVVPPLGAVLGWF